ncbi:MAG: DUF6706 family protein [Bacteroidales bacterium]
MIIKDYITQKFQTYGLQLTDADIFDIMGEKSVEETINEDVIPIVEMGIIKFIPSLLLHASVSESGFSVNKARSEDVLKYYSFLCDKYNKEDKFSNTPKCEFL